MKFKKDVDESNDEATKTLREIHKKDLKTLAV